MEMTVFYDGRDGEISCGCRENEELMVWKLWRRSFVKM